MSQIPIFVLDDMALALVAAEAAKPSQSFGYGRGFQAGRGSGDGLAGQR